jgi:hypothetical protein
VPGDTGASVVERAARGGGALFAAMQPVPRAAIERAVARMPRSAGGLIMSPASHVWSLLKARRRDDEKRFRRLSGASLH